MTTEIKYFTPADARKTLPLVKNIVRDILQTTQRNAFDCRGSK